MRRLAVVVMAMMMAQGCTMATNRGFQQERFDKARMYKADALRQGYDPDKGVVLLTKEERAAATFRADAIQMGVAPDGSAGFIKFDLMSWREVWAHKAAHAWAVFVDAVWIGSTIRLVQGELDDDIQNIFSSGSDDEPKEQSNPPPQAQPGGTTVYVERNSGEVNIRIESPDTSTGAQ